MRYLLVGEDKDVQIELGDIDIEIDRLITEGKLTASDEVGDVLVDDPDADPDDETDPDDVEDDEYYILSTTATFTAVDVDMLMNL